MFFQPWREELKLRLLVTADSLLVPTLASLVTV